MPMILAIKIASSAEKPSRNDDPWRGLFQLDATVNHIDFYTINYPSAWQKFGVFYILCESLAEKFIGYWL